MNNELQHNLDYLIANLDKVSEKFKNKDSKKYLQRILDELQYKVKKQTKLGQAKHREKKRYALVKAQHQSNKHKKQRAPLVIKDMTPDILKDISDEITQSLHKTPNKNIQLGDLNSFSPEINKQLITLKTLEKTDVFSNCKALDKNKLAPTVWNGVKCIKFDNMVAQQVLLANLSSKTVYPVENIIAPKQIQSNCWFNCMFMTFFISDKGRKFFKFFRKIFGFLTK